MGRLGISFEEVAKAAFELQGAGINPTVDAIRQELKTGSRSTISRYLNEWRVKQREREGAAIELPQELYSLTKGLYNRIQEVADQKIANIESTSRTEMDSIREALNLSQAQALSLEKENQALREKLIEASKSVEKLNLDLKNYHQQNLNLSLKNEEMENRVQDKILQLTILEKQLDNVQANLEHYRQTIDSQRENDKRSWERESSLLKQNIRECQSQVNEKNNINQNLNQKFELVQDQNSKIEKLYYQEKIKASELEEQLKSNATLLKDLDSKYQALFIKNQDIDQKLLDSQKEINQLEKENLLWKERRLSTENTMKRSEDTLAILQNERLLMIREIAQMKAEVKKLEQV